MSEIDPEKMQALNDAVAKFGAALQTASHTFRAQGAIGWLMRGDLEKARGVLESLPVEVLTQVSLASAVLSSLADEVAARMGDR